MAFLLFRCLWMASGNMVAIVLAAGKGVRMWPLTYDKPKPLLPVLCKPILGYHLDSILETGIKDVILVVQKHKEMIESFIKERKYDQLLKLKVVEQGETLGTGHAVLKAINESHIESEQALIVYSDVFMEPNSLKESITSIIEMEGNWIGVTEKNQLWKYGVIITDSSGNLTDIVEKPNIYSEDEKKPVNAGIMKLDTELLKESLEKIGPSPRGEIELTDAIKNMAKKANVKVTLFKGNWIDVGMPWDLITANRIALKDLCERASIPLSDCIFYNKERLLIEDPVIIDGPVYIEGKNELGPCSHLREYSVICGENKIGFSVQIKGSIIMKGAKVPHLNYVGDSIVGENVNLGAGTITANVRHDGKNVKSVIKGNKVDTGMKKLGAIIGSNVKTGINTTILPGVKIGANSWINAGCIVDEDVPDNSFLTCSQNKKILERRAI